MRPAAAIALVAVAVAGCGEKPQTATTKKTDAKGYELSASTHVAEGWKAGGDKSAWDAQLRARAQRGQDEYPRSRSPAAAAPAAVVTAASAAPMPKTTP